MGLLAEASPKVADLPGPAGSRWSGNLAAFESDRLGFLLRAREEHGDLVRFDALTTVVNDPVVAREVLLDREARFAIRENFLGVALGDAEVRETRELRPLLNPVMRRGRAVDVAERVAAAVRGELVATRCRPVDPLPLLERVAAGVVAACYFGTDGSRVVGGVRDLHAALDARFGSVFALPASWPTPLRRRTTRAHRALEATVLGLLAQRTASPGNDMVSDLVRGVARRADPPTSRRLAQVVIGSLLASYRVPAAAAAWLLWEVARDPALQEAVRAEALGTSAPPPAGVPLADLVLQESLRLHPPTWLLHRTLLRDGEVGDHRAPRGHNVLISPYVLQRDPRCFADPDRFDPGRWLGAERESVAMVPFGRGPHGCPGRHLGEQLLRAVLLTTVREHDVVLVADGPVTPDPRSTLVPRGLRLVFTPRG